jgi:surfeit locus 1 family protein
VRDGTNGYNVITPLVRENGSTILVDRGFVSEEHANIDKLRGEPSNERMEVLGMLRTAGKRNRFTPDNHPEKGEWFWLDVNAMAEHAGGEPAGLQPVFVEAIFGMSFAPPTIIRIHSTSYKRVTLAKHT